MSKAFRLQPIKFGQPISYNGKTDSSTLITYYNTNMSMTVVPTFLCPSDNSRGAVFKYSLYGNYTGSASGLATTNYKSCGGMNWGLACSYSGTVATGVITGTMGRNAGNADGMDHGNGFICRGAVTSGTMTSPPPFITANMDIRDGTSTTFAIGETIPQFCPYSLGTGSTGSPPPAPSP